MVQLIGNILMHIFVSMQLVVCYVSFLLSCALFLYWIVRASLWCVRAIFCGLRAIKTFCAGRIP